MSVAYVAVENVADVDQLKAVLADSGPMLIRSVNETGRWAHGEAGKRIKSGNLGWNSGYINSKTLAFKPARSVRAGAVISARSRPTTLSRFNALTVRNGFQKGVRVEVIRGKPKVLMGAFMTTMRGNALVMMREGRYRQLKDVNAYKYAWNGLVALYGPSVDQVFKTHRDGPDGIANAALDRLEESFSKLWEMKNA